jgi:hypothetical protein
MAFVESFVSDDGTDLSTPPVMEFYETTELRGQFDNWVGPNTACLLAFCRSAGFVRVQLQSVMNCRAHVSCFRKWAAQDGTEAAPYVTCVENSVSLDHAFSTRKDDYVSIWFKSPHGQLTCDNVFPQIGPYASRPVVVQSTGGDGWHANCKLPPGLEPGWYDTRLRVRDSAASNVVRIGVDVPEGERRNAAALASSGDLRIRLVTDGRSWERYRVRVGMDSCVSLWASGLPEDCDRSQVRVRLNGTDMPAVFVSSPDAEGATQVNALLPYGLRPGSVSIVLVSGDRESPPVDAELV